MSYERLYVGNIPYNIDGPGLVDVFRGYGYTADRPHIVIDRETGQSKGFGFVNVPTGMADSIIQALNGSQVDGRSIRVDKAHDRGPGAR